MRPHRQGRDRRDFARQGEHGVDVGAAAEPIAEELPAAEEGPGYEMLSGPRGVADDLKKLAHVSPTIEKKLKTISAFSTTGRSPRLGPRRPTRSAKRLGLPGRVEGWIAQSKELSAE